MQFQGGKSFIGLKIGAVLNSLRKPNQVYFEPCMGGCSILQHITDGPNEASDLCPELVALFQAVQAGWDPPTTITESDYQAIQHGFASDELRAFAGFGCSYGGKWWGGYARGHGDYAKHARNSLLLKFQKIHPKTTFHHRSLYDVNPCGGLMYFDPPYKSTERYRAVEKFDHERFWEHVRELSKTNTVIVSEFEAPEDFETIWSMDHATRIRDGSNKPKRTVEKLFKLQQDFSIGGQKKD